MRGQKSEAATKDRPGCLVSNPEPYSKNLPNPQSNSGPEVIVYRRGASVYVALSPRPWGWPNPDKQFFDTGAAERYAARLKGKLAAVAKKEAARRERLWQARIREAEERHAAVMNGGGE